MSGDLKKKSKDAPPWEIIEEPLDLGNECKKWDRILVIIFVALFCIAHIATIHFFSASIHQKINIGNNYTLYLLSKVGDDLTESKIIIPKNILDVNGVMGNHDEVLSQIEKNISVATVSRDLFEKRIFWLDLAQIFLFLAAFLSAILIVFSYVGKLILIPIFAGGLGFLALLNGFLLLI